MWFSMEDLQQMKLYIIERLLDGDTQNAIERDLNLHFEIIDQPEGLVTVEIIEYVY